MLREKSTELDWDLLDTKYKYGRCLVKKEYSLEQGIIRTRWEVDESIPFFKEDREYIEKYVYI